MPPSHFASTVPSTEAQTASGSTSQPHPPQMRWVNQAITRTPPGAPSIVKPWLAITPNQQEMFEMKKENQRIMMLQGNSRLGRMSADPLSDVGTRYFHCVSLKYSQS